eukprot:8697913-Karenia_brevis.AAC.1
MESRHHRRRCRSRSPVRLRSRPRGGSRSPPRLRLRSRPRSRSRSASVQLPQRVFTAQEARAITELAWKMQWIDRHLTADAMRHLSMARAVVVDGLDGQQWVQVPVKNCRVFPGHQGWLQRWHGTYFTELSQILEDHGRLRPGDRQADRAGRKDSNGNYIDPGVW